MEYIIDPEIAIKLEEQLLIGEEETTGKNLFQKPLKPTDECHICLDPLPYLQRDRLMCFLCSVLTCRKCHEKDVNINRRRSCDICKTVVKNPIDKREHIKKWINKGNFTLCINLGDSHRKGEVGYDGGGHAALYYYLMAAKHGVALGYKQIGDAYGYGVRTCGVPRDRAKCVRFLKVSAKMGCIEAHQRLFDLSKTADPQVACDHAAVLAKVGNQDAFRFIMDCYREGNIDPQVALNHAAALAKVGNEDAFTFVMDCYREGKIVRDKEFDDMVREFREEARK